MLSNNVLAPGITFGIALLTAIEGKEIVAYASLNVLSFMGWALVTGSAVIVVAALISLLFGIVSLEKGYKTSTAKRPGFAIQSADNGRKTNVHQEALYVLSRSIRSAPMEDALADLRAAEYLLCKVENGPAFSELDEVRRRDCLDAIARVRHILESSPKEAGELRFVS